MAAAIEELPPQRREILYGKAGGIRNDSLPNPVLKYRDCGKRPVQNPPGILSCTSCLRPLETISDAITSVVSCETIQRVALGALAFLIALPLASLAEHVVVDLMLRWGFDLSPAQD